MADSIAQRLAKPPVELLPNGGYNRRDMGPTYIRRINNMTNNRALSLFEYSILCLGVASYAFAGVKVTNFDKTADGKEVQAFTITDGNGITVKLLSRRNSGRMACARQEWPHVGCRIRLR